jgi:hypothetical protein
MWLQVPQGGHRATPSFIRLLDERRGGCESRPSHAQPDVTCPAMPEYPNRYPLLKPQQPWRPLHQRIPSPSWREFHAKGKWLRMRQRPRRRASTRRRPIEVRAKHSMNCAIWELFGIFFLRFLLSASGRGNFPAFSGEPGDRLRQPVGPRIQAQEANDRTLRLGQLSHHHLGLALTDSNLVPLDRREHLD